jgi:hypothetical protein
MTRAPTASDRAFAARILGHFGGKVGGPARAAKLTPEQRQAIAKLGGVSAAANKEARAGELPPTVPAQVRADKDEE